MSADKLVGFVDYVFSQYDALAQKYGLEKIKTIGDAYMLAVGVPEKSLDHATHVANFSLEMRALWASKNLFATYGVMLSMLLALWSRTELLARFK